MTTENEPNIDSIFDDEFETEDAGVNAADEAQGETTKEVVEPQPEPEGDVSQNETETEGEGQPDQDAEGKASHMVPIAEIQKTREQRNEYKAQVETAQAELNNVQQYTAKLEQEHRNLLNYLEQQNKQTNQQPVAPDPLEDPQGYESHILGQAQQALNPIQEQIAEIKLGQSHSNAVATYGNDVVNAAVQAADAAGVGQQLRVNSQNPYAEAVAWYQTQQLRQEVGNDPAAYKAQVMKEAREQALEELKAEQSQGNANPKIPPSIRNVTDAGNGQAQVLSDEDHFNKLFDD